MWNAKKFNKRSVPPKKKVAVNENSMKRKVNRNEAAAGPSAVGASNDVIHVKHSVKNDTKTRKVQEESASDFRQNYEFSDDSNFEEGLPLKELLIQGRDNDSVMSSISSRTRLGLKKRKFICCKEMGEKVVLVNYEGDLLLKKKVQVRLVQVDDDVKLQNKLGISGVQPLALSEDLSIQEEKVFRTSTPEMRSLNTKPALHNISPMKISNDMQTKFFNESSKITIDLTNDAEDKRDKFTWQGYHKGIGSCSSYRGLKNFMKGEN